MNESIGRGYSELTTALRPAGACEWCSSERSWVMHTGKCPKVAEIEYHRDGTVKRVRFHP